MQNALNPRRAVPEEREQGPWSATAVANTLLMIAGEHGVKLDPLKLQKLVYYAHGWALAILGRPLIDEQVQAWKYGPVVASVYHTFKRYGNQKITDFAASFRRDGSAYTPVLPSTAVDERKLLERIWSTYGKYSGVQLSTMTHEKGSPWWYAWRDNPQRLRYFGIGNERLARHFKSKAARRA